MERERDSDRAMQRHTQREDGARRGPEKGRNERNAVCAVNRLTHPNSFSSGRLLLIRSIQSWLTVTRQSGR